MSKPANSRLASFFGVFASAAAASAAVERGAQTKGRDLRRLGIDPLAFARIGR